MKTGLKRLIAEDRGAVVAEFVVAIIPLGITFFSFMQVAHLYTAHLVFKHAAFSAARAAIVTKSRCNPPMSGNDNGRESDVEDALRDGLGAGVWQNTFGGLSTRVQYAGSDKYGPVTTTSKALYKCSVPLGRWIVCPMAGFRPMQETIVLPHQGASYEGAGCNE
ncbi:hypothetical protein [Pendulispora albinea]|uniref:TadE-like protein n=1 Tax=Pendulispora albinea TaxID=2741071 RepID=A0ABZ2MBR6_9BACT